MCNGSIMDKLISFALPLMVSSILQLMFNAVDIIVIGRFSGSQSLAAVGSTTALIAVFTNLFIGISLGANVLAARFYAAGRHKEMSETVHTAITLALISGILMAVIGQLFARSALELMATPDDVINLSSLYLRIYFLGMPFFMLYNYGAAILRAVGDTKRPLFFLIISGSVNAILNLLLVIVFHLDVAGVAIATVISNVISASMVWYFLMRENGPIRLSFRKLKISNTELKKTLRIGMPAGLQGMVFSIANVCIQTALNGYGSDAVAGSAVALNFEYFTYFVIGAFNQTAVTFTSQNFGAAQYERCRKVYRCCIASSILITGGMSLIFLLGRGFFVSLFTTDPDVTGFAVIRMLYVLSFIPLASTYEIGGASLRGIGYSMTPAVLTVFGTCLFRLVWIYTVCRIFTDFRILMIVYPISWLITGASVLAAYYIIRKKVFSRRDFLRISEDPQL